MENIKKTGKIFTKLKIKATFKHSTFFFLRQKLIKYELISINLSFVKVMCGTIIAFDLMLISRGVLVLIGYLYLPLEMFKLI